MLTKTDLSSIAKIVDHTLDKKLDQKLEEKLEKKFEEKLKPIRTDVIQIRKDQKTIVNFFDHEFLDLRERVDRIEEYLKIPPLPQTS